MLMRPGEDHAADIRESRKQLSRSSSPAPVNPHDSAAAGSIPITRLPTLPRRVVAATFSGFTSGNDDGHIRADDIAHGSSILLSPSIMIEPPAKSACFRITGIPSDWSIHHLKQKLMIIDPELDFADVDLSGPFPASCDSTQTALLNFDNCTAYFQKFERNDEKLIVLRESDSDQANHPKVHLTIDKHFYDLTPMNKPEVPIAAELAQSLQVSCRMLTSIVCLV